MAEYRVLACRVNEPIDPRVFDSASVGFADIAAPDGSPIPSSRPIAVYRASMDEVTGERERRALEEGEEPVTLLGYTLRGDGGLPTDFAPVASVSADSMADRAVRWLVIVGAFAIAGAAVVWRVRSA
jgi:hypothetical protein